MSSGTVAKLVKTHGSLWGRIRPDGDTRELFFNVASMLRPEAFADLIEGMAVEFQEQADNVNGARAVAVSRLESGAALAAAAPARPANDA